jgi:hypothetical protein
MEKQKEGRKGIDGAGRRERQKKRRMEDEGREGMGKKRRKQIRRRMKRNMR